MEFTNEILEKCAEAVHKAYCNYHLQNKGTEYWTKGDYSLLDEPTKQIDRETVKAVFATIEANPVGNQVMQKIAEELLKYLDDVIRTRENGYTTNYKEILMKEAHLEAFENIKGWLVNKLSNSNFTA